MKVDTGNQTTDQTSHSSKKNVDDSQLKTILSQMENVREKMKRLSENKNILQKDKEKMMKQLQTEFQELKRKLITRQNEIIKEKMEKNKNRNKDNIKPDQIEKAESTAVKALEPENNSEINPVKAVHDLVGAKATMADMKMVNAIKKDMKNKSEILKSEIVLNKRYFMPIAQKEEEIYELNEKINKINGHDVRGYSDVQKSIEKAKNTTLDKANIESIDEEHDTNTSEKEIDLDSSNSESSFDMQI